MNATALQTQGQRRTDLDWVRIAAFAILILFHVGMFYAPMGWVVKSPRILPWLQVVLDWSSPWRLLVLFAVSGAATRFMLDKMPIAALVKSRSARLLPPLVLAVVVMVPPQAFYQAIEQYGYQGKVLPFLARYFTGYRGLCDAEGQCLAVPHWNHLWFVAYLWLYTMALGYPLLLFPSLPERIQSAGRWWLRGWRLLAVPAAALVVVRLALKHFFPESHDVDEDWYLHATYSMCFVFGFVFAPVEAVWDGFMERRWLALAAGIVAYAVYATYAWIYRASPAGLPLRFAMTIVYGVDQWSWVVAAFGFARRHLSGRDGPVRRYLTDAIFPYYIIHQTAIVVVAHNLARLRLPLGVEAELILAATVASCALTYEVVRRVAWLRPWFGLKRLGATRSLPLAPVLEPTSHLSPTPLP